MGFNRVTADSNVEGATIDGGAGLITVGAEASYQVNKILLRTLGRCMFISFKIHHSIYGQGKH